LGPQKILLANARSLLPKYDDLLTLLASQHPDVVACCETWLSNNTPDEFFMLPNFDFFRLDRANNKRGGGVAVWCHKSLAASLFFSNSNDLCECIWISLNNVKVLFGAYYIPPNISLNKSLCNTISNDIIDICDSFLLCNSTFNIIISGDFNQFNLSEIVNNLHLRSIVTDSTRKDVILDNILISDTIADLFNSSVGPPLQAQHSESDHRTIIAVNSCITTDLPCNIVRYAKCMDLRQEALSDAIIYLHSINWFDYYFSNDCNSMCDILHDHISISVSKIPSNTVYFTTNDAPWMNIVFKDLINK